MTSMKKSFDSPAESQGVARHETPGGRRILEAATACFARQGYDAASVRKIAADANVDPALINHAFGSKAGLWQACVDQVAEGVIPALRGATAQACSSLAEAVDRLIEVVCADPVIVHFILSEIARQDERFDYVHMRLVKPIHALMLESMGRGEAVSASAQEEVRLIAISGAIATTIVSRGFMIRGGLIPDDFPAFRRDLRSVLEPLLNVPKAD